MRTLNLCHDRPSCDVDDALDGPVIAYLKNKSQMFYGIITLIGQQFRPTLDLLCKEDLSIGLLEH